MKYTIIFDTETTGLPLSHNANLGRQPYMVEFYGVKIDEEFNIVSEFDHLIRPPIPMPCQASSVNGITDEMLKGMPRFAELYDEFADFWLNTHRSVAHNHPFDEKIVAYELMRIEKDHKFPWAREQICTVEKSKHIYGRRLRLGQLHKEMTNKPFKEGAHRAKNDVFALVRSYHAMIEAGMIAPV